MQDLQTRLPPSATAGMKATITDMQREAIVMVIVGVFAAAMPLIVIAEASTVLTQVLQLSTLLCLLAVGAGIVATRSYTNAAWALVLGTFGIILLLVGCAGLMSALPLVSICVALAALLISAGAGGRLAILASALLLLPHSLLPADVATRILTLIQVWATVGVITLMQRPMLTAVAWSWFSYERAHRLVEEMQDKQVRLKQTLDDLADANRQLAQLNEYARRMRLVAEEARLSKERFVANVSHELRTPLNMIIGFAELMLSSPGSYGRRMPAQVAADVEIILRNARHLSDLINDILDLSQVEAGRMAITKERASMAEIVETAMATVGGLFATKGLYLTADVPPDLPLLLCDPTRIRQVLLNLLSNAARFTEKGGVHISVQQDRDCLLVSVADTGPGVDPKQIDRLFQPFEQLDGSIRRRYGGTGLGLSISKHFVELHGGNMWVESEPGHGCTVRFRLPIAPGLPQPADAGRWLIPGWDYRQRTRASLAAPPTVTPRVVLVEKGDMLRRLLARYLDNTEIVPVPSLADAVAETARLPANAVIVNNSSVPQALEQLSAGHAFPVSLPVFVCAIPEATAAAQAVGASEYLVKPVAQDRLLALLDALCPPRGTVLVVDDEEEALVLFMRMLQASDKGYRVVTADNGSEALRIMREQKPSVVLLDLVMPEMDGFQVLHTCQSDPELAGIPVVVISARDPLGQPVVSSAVAVTQTGGLSAAHIVAIIQAMQTILTPARLSPDQEQPAAPPG